MKFNTIYSILVLFGILYCHPYGFFDRFRYGGSASKSIADKAAAEAAADVSASAARRAVAAEKAAEAATLAERQAEALKEEEELRARVAARTDVPILTGAGYSGASSYRYRSGSRGFRSGTALY
ncbi:hypothetical protein TCON_0901 [Astathelohania contejeani]|uniref:Uncharacterized protein n=1 Tax=Astathelohania contejeani TaxID=164912 RepID=A0ABQ7I0K2_9MICR|nr:hypothetical protein TCON_0901 [Thelohania contejeani]